MKARVRFTKNVVDVRPLNYVDRYKEVYEADELDFNIPEAMSDKSSEQESDMDDKWDERRYEIAKAVLPFMWLDDGQAQRAEAAQGRKGFEYKRDDMLAREAVQLADALIDELKKPRKKKEE